MALAITLLGDAVDPSDTGLAPYKVQGDPVIAFIAQVNRYAGKTLKIGDVGSAQYIKTPLQLAPSSMDTAVIFALSILGNYYNGGSIDLFGTGSKAVWLANGRQVQGDTPFVMANLNELTLTLAQLGDSLGLDPAVYGITAVDPRITPKSKIGYYIGGGVLVLLGIAAAYSRRRAQ